MADLFWLTKSQIQRITPTFRSRMVERPFSTGQVA